MRTSFFVFQFITTVTNLPLRTSLKRKVSSSIQWAIAASWKFQHAVVVTGMNLLLSCRSTDAERAALVRLGEASVEVGLEHGHVAVVRAPRVDREVAGEQVLVRSLRDGAGLAPFRERREFFGLEAEAEAQRGEAGEADG